MDHQIRIDPTLPMCWDSTESLRVGFDRAEARILEPSVRTQRMISLLRHGISMPDFLAAARGVGLRKSESIRLLHDLSPVLLRLPAPAAPALPQLTILGTGAFSDSLRAHLRASGFDLGAGTDTTERFVIVIERFLAPARNMQEFLISRTPHLPIRFTDRSMWVGPLVLPGGSPCMSCVELNRLEGDPALAIMAAQLTDAVPAAESLACVELAASLIATSIRKYAHGRPDLLAHMLHYTVHEGVPDMLPSTHKVLGNRGCACRELAQSVEGDPETGLSDETRGKSPNLCGTRRS